MRQPTNTLSSLEKKKKSDPIVRNAVQKRTLRVDKELGLVFHVDEREKIDRNATQKEGGSISNGRRSVHSLRIVGYNKTKIDSRGVCTRKRTP